MRIKSLAGAGVEAEVVVVGGVLKAELEEASAATSQSTGSKEQLDLVLVKLVYQAINWC